MDSEPTGATLRVDPQRLTQALLNLLQNAARHARGDGPVRLRVHAEPSSWRFEVADDGGGLPPGEEQLAFDPSRTRAAEGHEPSCPASGGGRGASHDEDEQQDQEQRWSEAQQ